MADLPGPATSPEYPPAAYDPSGAGAGMAASTAAARMTPILAAGNGIVEKADRPPATEAG